jgi:hypothetical protein
VIASSRVNTFQEAYQIGSLIVLPLVLVVVGQAMGAFALSDGLVALFGLALWGVAGGVFALAASTFRRTSLLARL